MSVPDLETMPIRPRLWMKPGIIPILHWPGAIIPGQLGPTSRVLPWVLRISVMRTMSCWGIPSVMQTTRGISASIASSMPFAATGGGTKIAEAVAPVCWTASRTFAKTGFPRCVSPAFLGFVPPTTLVPGMYQWRLHPVLI